MRKKLEIKAGKQFTFDLFKPHTWVRQEFNREVKELREVRQQEVKERLKFINDEIDAALLKQDMSRE